MSKFYKVLIGPATNPVSSGGDGVQTVTGNGVDNTDPLNPVLSFPDPSDIGLGNVDNTSDADKPISNATQTALNDKANDADLDSLEGRVTTNEDDIETLQNNQVNPNNFVNKVTSTTQDMTGRLTVQTPVDSNISDAASVGYVLSKTDNKLNSVTTGEPTGATVIGNVVEISQADYDTAFNAGNLVATTLYLTPDA